MALALFYFFWERGKQEGEQNQQPIKSSSDTAPPLSVVFLPDYSTLDQGGWHTSDFARPVVDRDEGESGLSVCRYAVFDTKKKVFSVPFRERVCNTPLFFGMGGSRECSSQGEESCILFVESEDEAGNMSITKEDGEGLVVYSIDWEAPAVGELFLPGVESNEDGYIAQSGDTVNVKASVKDEVGVSNCDLKVNKKSQYEESGYMELSERPCQDCVASSLYTFVETGMYEVEVYCWDKASLIGSNSRLLFADYEVVKKEQERKNNRAPVVDVCRVVPTTGTFETRFEFLVTASDANNDVLEYVWDFGDGTKGRGEGVSHRYVEKGIYTPKVTVSDGKEGTASCLTAWVVVQ